MARQALEQKHRKSMGKASDIGSIQTAGAASTTRSIADAVVIKDENIFLVMQPDTDVPIEPGHGFGLYYHDCRYLNGYEFRLAGTEPDVLVYTQALRYEATFQLSNLDLHLDDESYIPKQQVGVKLDRLIRGDECVLLDRFTLTNYGVDEIRFPISLAFRAEFEDIFEVRGQLGRRHKPEIEQGWQDGVLCFNYHGQDGFFRTLGVHFSPAPKTRNTREVEYEICLAPKETTEVLVVLQIQEGQREEPVRQGMYTNQDFKQALENLEEAYRHWEYQHTRIETDSPLVNQTIEQSSRDLRVLRSNLHNRAYFAAGIPWFATLFGRDSLITALQTLSYNPDITEQTLRILARFQGRQVNDDRDEEPGKILHEYRMDEFTRQGRIPYDPYYGSIDATLLFLILLGCHASWVGNLRLFEDLQDSVEAALGWMQRHGDFDQDGYIEYACHSEKGLINHGWKDSGNAMVDAEGNLARQPIALVEVQGYVYMAQRLMAKLFRQSGDQNRARQLEQQAEDLKERFNRDFWLPDQGFYAMALQGDENDPLRVISSNPGHALWSGIVDEDKARLTMDRLMADDMFAGWGIRTLARSERGYNPVGYHLGTIWPHDNSIIASGFKRYGFNEAVCRVFSGLMEAAMHFPDYQLPEAFAGYGKDEFIEPGKYPVAAHPQAWAAGSVPFLIQTLLGLTPNAFEHRLRIVKPTLPDFIDRLHMQQLRVGEASVDLFFRRTPEGVSVQVERVEGKLDIAIEP